MREVIRPEGHPIIVRLDFDEPIQREGRHGIDYQYTVNHDAGIMWLPKEAKQKIDALQAQAGDEISIAKTKRGNKVAWLIERVDDETAPQPQRQQQQTAQHIGRPSGHQPEATEPVTQRPNGQGPLTTAERQAARPAEQYKTSQRPEAEMLAGALYCAIDAAISAEQYADQRGRALKLDNDDIRAMAISLYIDARKDALK